MYFQTLQLSTPRDLSQEMRWDLKVCWVFLIFFFSQPLLEKLKLLPPQLLKGRGMYGVIKYWKENPGWTSIVTLRGLNTSHLHFKFIMIILPLIVQSLQWKNWFISLSLQMFIPA